MKKILAGLLFVVGVYMIHNQRFLKRLRRVDLFGVSDGK